MGAARRAPDGSAGAPRRGPASTRAMKIIVFGAGAWGTALAVNACARLQLDANGFTDLRKLLAPHGVFVAVEPERNALRFDNNTSYPLNRVRAVWHNGTQWCISVDAMDLA